MLERPKRFVDDLDEADFFIRQKCFYEALSVLKQLDTEFPHSAEVEVRLRLVRREIAKLESHLWDEN